MATRAAELDRILHFVLERKRIMARNWIVVGDPTSSGGRVITGSSRTDIDGMSVARVGDKATCPTLHQGEFPIVEGDITTTIDGQPVALHGSALACGCRVLSTQQTRVYVITNGGGGRTPAGDARPTELAPALQPATSPSPRTFDQSIRFVSSRGDPLAELPYTLYLDDGRAFSGTTDAQGGTARVSTAQSQALARAELRPPTVLTGCCVRMAPGTADAPEIFDLEGVITTPQDMGVSVVEVSAPSHERSLTFGEIEMARLVFGDSVDYSRVKVHNHGYWLFFGFQHKDTGVTPNGEMYFPKVIYYEDFSAVDVRLQAFFIHEMTHVWQYQLGYDVKLVRGPRPGMSYDYILDESKRFHDYNMEAQGDMLADYFLVIFRSSQEKMNNRRYRATVGVSAQLERALSGFLADRSNEGNLPRTIQ
ncbi:TPA: PAAR domain-containing protein [Stenotrophomonas maltophilia]